MNLTGITWNSLLYNINETKPIFNADVCLPFHTFKAVLPIQECPDKLLVAIKKLQFVLNRNISSSEGVVEEVQKT